LVIIYTCTLDFLAQSLKYGIATGKMPPRNPTTRCSPRESNMKEAETGEGSSPWTTRQLEYAPRVETVIKHQKQKSFV